MKLLLTLFTSLSCTVLLGQATTNDTVALRATFKPNPNQPIVYVAQTSFGWRKIKETLKPGTYIAASNSTYKEPFILTRKEIKAIDQQIDQYQSFVWPDNLFANSIKIPFDSMFIYADRGTKSQTVKGNVRTWVYSFSKPIYLRDGNVCLIYTSAICGTDCGYEKVVLYIKQNGVWNPWINMALGDY